MANIIAVIWDCDRTLVDGYMQDPLVKNWRGNSPSFMWEMKAPFSTICMTIYAANICVFSGIS